MKKTFAHLFLYGGLILIAGSFVATYYEGADSGAGAFTIAGAILAGSGLIAMTEPKS